MITAGATLTLDVEKATAGGRMLARHQGQVVLVWGAIPGERVDARIERTGKGVAYAETVDVRSPSPDRRTVLGDWRCGGNVLAHIDYARQRRLKGEIIHDAFARLGRILLPEPPDVIGSPEEGYRMRARLHARDGRLGFYREGTHQLCDADATRQLLPSTNEWIAQAQVVIQRQRLDDVLAIEIAENLAGDERAGHVEVRDAPVDRYAALANGLVGLSVRRHDVVNAVTVAGTPVIHDVVQLHDDGIDSLRLRRHARAFFQGNRFLVARLVREVIASVRPGPVVDLYAGGGLFGLALASTGTTQVTLVEGDPISGEDLVFNAAPFEKQVRVERRSVEMFLNRASRGGETVIVDPPRTGLSKEALAGIVRAKFPAIVYVSCDVATLARDARGLRESGYQLSRVAALDLFPNTAHVETVAVFSRV